MWYEETLKTFFLELKRRQVVLKQTWFQQEEVTSHASSLVILTVLDRVATYQRYASTNK